MDNKKEELKIGDKVNFVGEEAKFMVSVDEVGHRFKCVYGVVKGFTTDISHTYNHDVRLVDYKGVTKTTSLFRRDELEKI